MQTKSLCKSYISHGRVVDVLRDINLTVNKGDIYGIIGLSGAGKSTLIRAFTRLITPTSGQILFHDTDIAAMDKNALSAYRKKIGMIFQNFNLLTSRTVAGNVAYPLEIDGVSHNEIQPRVDKLLGFVGLSEKKNTYPAQLSGGEMQRVGIARALANNPEVLLCDEATSALDPKTTMEILSLLKGVNREFGVTIILITHEMEVIRQTCNKVAVLEKGEIVEEGEVASLFSAPKHPTTRSFLRPYEVIVNGVG